MGSNGIGTLPADLFHLLSAELSNRLDFDTLYNCVASSKQIANSGAISALYRISHDSPIKGGGSEDLSLSEQDLTVQRWSILWRTLIMSALGQTSYPYCKHLRMLDLRDFGYLLDEDKFKQGRILKNFFSGPLERFHLTVEAPVRQGSRNRPKRLDMRAIVLAVGNVITEQSPLLEALTEPTIDGVFSTALPSWVSRLSHLKRLDLFDGSALADEAVCEMLHSNCPLLDSLTIYSATSEDADKQIAAFISGRRPNSLVHFENISNCHIGLDTAVALNKHGKSLAVIKLYLTGDKLQALGCLRECTSVHTLAIEYSGPADDLKKNDNDLYLEIAEWLRNCNELRDISITNMVSAPDMILPILLTDSIQLRKLQINSNEGLMYLVKDHQDFHQSLGQKQSLQELFLRADPEGLFGDPLAEVTNSICSLSNLRYLHLTRVSDYFSNQHVNAFAQYLVNLEHIYIGGYGITDGVWNAMARLKNLKTLTFSGLTMFTAQGILSFVDQLGDGNQGLLLGVDNADADSPLTSEEQELVQEALTAKVNGSFAYQLLRDPNMPEFDSEDDSD